VWTSPWISLRISPEGRVGGVEGHNGPLGRGDRRPGPDTETDVERHRYVAASSRFLAPPARLELATSCLEGRCSIRLSYGGRLRNDDASRGQDNRRIGSGLAPREEDARLVAEAFAPESRNRCRARRMGTERERGRAGANLLAGSGSWGSVRVCKDHQHQTRSPRWLRVRCFVPTRPRTCSLSRRAGSMRPYAQAGCPACELGDTYASRAQCSKTGSLSSRDGSGRGRWL
jgi:hypothetical protein